MGKGSGVMTSRPAAKILPSFNAVTRSSWKIESQITSSTDVLFFMYMQLLSIAMYVHRLTWLMIPPLLVLINMLEVFIMSKVFVLNKWCSSGEKAQVTRTKSDTWKSCSGLVAQVVKAVQALFLCTIQDAAQILGVSLVLKSCLF